MRCTAPDLSHLSYQSFFSKLAKEIAYVTSFHLYSFWAINRFHAKERASRGDGGLGVP